MAGVAKPALSVAGGDLPQRVRHLGVKLGETARSYGWNWVMAERAGRRTKAGESLPELPKEPIRHDEP